MTARKNIVFVSQYFPPDITAAAFRVSETALLLQDKGFDVTVLTAFPHKSRTNRQQYNGSVKVIRVPIKKIKKENADINGYLLHYCSFMINSFFWGLTKIHSKPDFIIATSPPLFVALSGWLLARLKRAKFVLDIRDIWPDSAVGTGHLRKPSLPYRIGKYLERFVYRRADLITCVSEQMKTYITNQKETKSPVIVLYNGLSKQSLESIRTDNTKKTNGDTLSISYFGNLGYAQNLDLIIDSAAQLKNKNIKFILVGDGAAKKNLIQKAAAAGLNNIIFKNSCDKKEALEQMSQSDALIITLNNNCMAFNMTIPSKVFDYLGANKPILYAIQGQGKQLLDSLPGNLYFDPGKPGSLANAAMKIKDNYDYYLTHASQNRGFVLKNFTRETMVDKLQQCLV